MKLRPQNFRARLLRPVLFLLVAMTTAAGQQAATDEIEGYDLSMLDRKIAEVVAKANEKGASKSDREAAAAAYLERANMFRDAGRPTLYKLAVGDFRRALRFQPGLAEAREKLDEIVDIYKSMGRPSPTNGNEGDAANDPKFTYKVKPALIKIENDAVNVTQTLAAGVGYWYEFEGLGGKPLSVRMKSGASPAAFSLYFKGQGAIAPLADDAAAWDGIMTGGGKYLIKVPPRNTEHEFTLKLTVK